VFEVGRVYRRADIHAEYKGQQYGGIITPAEHPVVFLITGESGRKYGYHDHWDEAGVFHYYGEGQVGDMAFDKGNAAITTLATKKNFTYSSGCVPATCAIGERWRVRAMRKSTTTT
jgi:5-methylcytosine-specific restriction protein A